MGTFVYQTGGPTSFWTFCICGIIRKELTWISLHGIDASMNTRNCISTSTGVVVSQQPLYTHPSMISVPDTFEDSSPQLQWCVRCCKGWCGEYASCWPQAIGDLPDSHPSTIHHLPPIQVLYTKHCEHHSAHLHTFGTLNAVTTLNCNVHHQVIAE